MPEPANTKLSDRVTYAKPTRLDKSEPLTKNSNKPKPQPKSAVANKTNAKGPKAGKPKKTKNPKPKSKPKTVDELDAEMADYFQPATNSGAAGATTAVSTATNGATQPAAAGEDLGMDEISVSSMDIIT